MQEFYKFLDGQIRLSEFEAWIYESTGLAEVVSEDHYQFLLEFDYQKHSAAIEVKDFIINHVIGKDRFIHWKIDELLDTHGLQLPEEGLFPLAKHNPGFLKGRQFNFRSYRTGLETEILWTDKVSRHTGQNKENREEYLYLGTYEKGYIHLLVNRKNEIWIAYDIINKEEYFAKDLREAISKVFIKAI